MSVSDDPRTPALSWNGVRGDFFGGVAAGVVALPLALAFGVSSGLGPVAGLYGAIAIGIVAAVFGGTPVQISGPTGPMTLVVAGIVATNTLPSGAVNLPGVVTIIVLAGLLQIALGLFRIGAYIRYVPYPVISGFMSGIGVIIILQQLFPMLGAEPPSSEPLSILRQLHLLGGNIKWAAVALSALTIATAFILPRFTKAVPASLVALVALTALAVLLGLEVSVIGKIPSGLPSLVMPSLDFQRLPLLMAAAIQLAFLGAIDSLLTSLVADNLTRTQHDSNRELVGQGLGNIAAGLIGGIPGAGATMRTVAQRRGRRAKPLIRCDPWPLSRRRAARPVGPRPVCSPCRPCRSARCRRDWHHRLPRHQPSPQGASVGCVPDALCPRADRVHQSDHRGGCRPHRGVVRLHEEGKRHHGTADDAHAGRR